MSSDEPRPILVAVAWPYANGQLHLGHIAGAYLPADIFARYQRRRGNRVLMVSGSDAHGTPITVRAETESISPADVVNRYHPEFLKVWEQLGISFDLFTTTMTETHHRVTQDVFTKARERGFIEIQTSQQMFDVEAQRFLPDRYVEGTCPHCGYTEARGDQCENCGRTLDPPELIDPRSKISGSAPELRDTDHFFLLLSKLAPEVLAYLESRQGWRRHVINWATQFVKDGLHDRAITRDLTWGVPLPTNELGDSKRIYVWFDAVIGYLSASIEWAASTGDPDAWKAWWDPTNEQGQQAESYYFVGKDNVPFHAVFWPAILLARGGLNLPTDVPANQFVTFKGAKASKSAGVGRSVAEYLAVLQSDAIRYAVATVLPEQNDTDFSEDELIHRVNDELVAVWGNLVNRVFAMVNKNFEGKVPEPGPLTEADIAVLVAADEALEESGRLLAAVELRAALKAALAGAQAANGYLSETEPWKLAKSDPARAATVLHQALQAIAGLNVAFSPFIPTASTAVADAFGQSVNDEVGHDGWVRMSVAAGQQLGPLAPLFTKLEAPLFPEES